MSKHQISKNSNIEQQIDQWLWHKLAKKHKQIDNMPICPYLQKYRHKIMTVESNDPLESARVFCDLRNALDLEAVILHGPYYDYDDLVDICEEISKRYSRKDLTVLCMHPDTDNPPLPIEYNFYWPLIILQNTSTLDTARKLLLKNTNYYVYFNDSDK